MSEYYLISLAIYYVGIVALIILMRKPLALIDMFTVVAILCITIFMGMVPILNLLALGFMVSLAIAITVTQKYIKPRK